MKYSISESEDLGSIYGPLIRFIEEDTLGYRVVFAKTLKSPIAAIVLSQYLYWGRNRISIERGGWFYKTEEDLFNETGVSPKSQRTARNLLISENLIFVEKKGVPSKNWYRINYKGLADFFFKNSGPVHSWGEQDITKMDDKYSPSGTTGTPHRALLSITENTTENTTSAKADYICGSSDEEPLQEDLKELNNNINLGKKLLNNKPAAKSTKPTTPRGWTNLRREESGKEPLRTPRTEKQDDALRFLKMKDYFKTQGYEQHGMQFFLVENKKREAAVTKLLKTADEILGERTKDLIDWWFSGEGDWSGYEPEQCFMSKTIERFLNKDKGKDKKTDKPTTFAGIYD